MAEAVSSSVLRALDRNAFMAAFGGVFEHSPWVAEAAWEQGPFESLDALHAAMLRVIGAAARHRQLALVRAHPELAGRAAVASDRGEDSRREQAAAGLDRLTREEHARFHALNRAYRDKFGFPFVLAIKGLSAQRILETFAARLDNEPEAELAQCLREIGTIARFRLVEKGAGLGSARE